MVSLMIKWEEPLYNFVEEKAYGIIFRLLMILNQALGKVRGCSVYHTSQIYLREDKA